MADYPEKLTDFLETLNLAGDRQERIEMLIATADRFRPVPERVASRPYPEDHRAPNCESEAFVFTEDLADGRLKYHFAVENPQGISAMALAVILDDALSGEPAEDALKVPPDVIYEIFGKELSMGKSAGLMGMIQLLQYLVRRDQQRAPGADAEAKTP